MTNLTQKEEEDFNNKFNYGASHGRLLDIAEIKGWISQKKAEWQAEVNTDTSKAVKELYRIVSFGRSNKVSEETAQSASFLLKVYEEEKRSRYIQHLEETIQNLKSQFKGKSKINEILK